MDINNLEPINYPEKIYELLLLNSDKQLNINVQCEGGSSTPLPELNFVPLSGTSLGKEIKGTIQYKGQFITSDLTFKQSNNTLYEHKLLYPDASKVEQSLGIYGNITLIKAKYEPLQTLSEQYNYGFFRRVSDNIKRITESFKLLQNSPVYEFSLGNNLDTESSKLCQVLIDQYSYRIKIEDSNGSYPHRLIYDETGLKSTHDYSEVYQDEHFVQKSYVLNPNTFIQLLNNCDENQLNSIKSILGL